MADLLLGSGLPLSRPLAGRLPPAPGSGSLRLPEARRYWGAYLVSGLAAAFGVLRLGAALAGALVDPRTTLQYGAVRTTHLSVYFGLPQETALSPSLVTATNDHGVGHLWFLPGGRAAQASVVELPLLDVDPDGRLPLHLTVADLDRDGHPDLLVTPGRCPAMPSCSTPARGQPAHRRRTAAVGAAGGAPLMGAPQGERGAPRALVPAHPAGPHPSRAPRRPPPGVSGRGGPVAR